VKTANEIKPTISDILALLLLKLAKINRKKMSSDQSYDDFYEEFFEEKDNVSYNVDARMRVRRDTILNYLKNFPGNLKALDVGCGLGDVLAELPDSYTLSGVDYAKSNVSYAMTRLKGKAEIFNSSIYELPFDSDSIDIGLCLEVLEHIENDEKAVREISRVIKPGGILIAAVPYTYYWKSYKKLLGHFRHYTRTSFTELLLNNGFTKVDKYLPNFYRWHQKYSRNYALLTANYKLMNIFFRYDSLYSFKFPWYKQPSIKKMELKLESMKKKDENINYSTDDHSTFLAVRK